MTGRTLSFIWTLGALAIAPAPACDDEAARCQGNCADTTTAPDTTASTEVGDDADTTPDLPEPECGGALALADDFSANSPLGTWDTMGGAAAFAHLDGGRALVTLGPVPADGGFVSRTHFRFRDAAIRIEVVEVPDVTSAARSELRVDGDDGQAVAIGEQQGKLLLRRERNGASTLVGNLPYDRLAHRWWRLSEAAGVVAWETSPDDVTWTTQATFELELRIDTARVMLVAGTNERNTSPGDAVFDNLNGGHRTRGWCHASDWSDDFEADAFSSHWRPWRREGCSLVLADGQVSMQPVPDTDTGCGITSFEPVDLRDGSASVHVLQAMEPTGGSVSKLMLIFPNGDTAEISNVARHLYLRMQTGSDIRTFASDLFDPALHQWWRLREHLGVLYWDLSGDTIIWKTYAAQAIDQPLDAVFVELFITEFHKTTEPGAFRFDDFNILPFP